MKNNNQDITDTGLNDEQQASLRNASVSPPAGAWRKIERSVRRKSQLIFLYRIAAIMALSGVIIFAFQMRDFDPTEVQPQAVVPPVENSKSASGLAASNESTESASPPTIRVHPKSSTSAQTTVGRTQSPPDLDVKELAENSFLPETGSESTVEPAVAQPSESTSIEVSSLEPAGNPITIIYELPAPEFESSRRQVTVSRIFGFAADLKSGQANLGLFRSIRQVFTDQARRTHQQNTNLQ